MESLAISNVDLEDLSDVEGTFHFTDSEDTKQAIRDFFDDAFNRDSLCDHTILITGFPAQSLITDDDDDIDDDELIIPPKFKLLYLKNSETTFITMRSSPHEIAGLMFGRILDRKLTAMNCADEYIPTGAAIVKMTNVQKMPDQSWYPPSRDYITLAVEAGVSESKGALARDAKIWLEHAESHVSQVVVIKISRTRPEILFSIWKATRQERDTRAHHPRRATKVQNVHVTLGEGGGLEVDGSICLSFEELFERKSQSGTAEKDITFSTRDLSGIARIVWEEMGFIPRPPPVMGC